jgi:putative serine protease PepD
MANHPSDLDPAAGGPHEGISRVHAEQPRHAEPPDRGTAPATVTAQMPVPDGWPGRAGSPPESGAHVAAAPWAGGWPAARPADGHRPEDTWPATRTAAPSGFAGWAPDGQAGQPGQNPAGPVPWYGAPGARYAEHPAGAPVHRPPDPGNPYHAAQSPVFGPPPGTYYLEPPGRPGSPRRRALVAAALGAVLISGVLGGVVGHSLADSGRGGSIGVLGEPLPEIDEAAAPATPVEAVAARVLPSVVQLRVDGPASSGEGSAMVLSADGLLLTNNHVVEEAADVGTVTAVFQNGTTAAALIVGRDPSSDLAVIRAQNVSGLVPVELGNSDAVRVGQQVVAFGAPLGLGGTVTTGIISAVDRAVNVGEETGANTPTVLNALQTDAAINPGNSGGPLVDMEGRVIGINSAIATTGAQGGSIGVGFSIPVNQARRVAEELERTGRASRAVLGVTVGDDPRQAGAVIRGVAAGGAAEQAGIREGDIVLRFGDQRISTGTDLQAAVGSRAPGEVVEVQLADRTVQATLTAAPN